MKWFIFIAFMAVAEIGFSQTSDSTFYFSGYVLDEESLPVENAYLINYRTLRAFAVDEHGRFSAKVQLGDSLKINHLAFQQKVIYANNLPESCNVYTLKFEPYIIETVTVKHRDIELENFNRNMALIFVQMKIKQPQYQRGNVGNTYSPEAQSAGFGINLSDLIGLFKKK